MSISLKAGFHIISKVYPLIGFNHTKMGKCFLYIFQII